jgi:transcriptional regulator with XRE-family HTH domain
LRVSIGARIRKARREAGLSQAQLADLMKVTRSACSQWEQPNGTAPRGSRLQRLAMLLGVSVEWLATGHEPGPRAAYPTPRYHDALTREEREILDRFARLDRDGQQALLGVLRRLRALKR